MGLGAALIAVICALQTVLGGAVGADPTSSADQLLARYTTISHEAEVSAEAMHNAQIEYDKQRGIVAAAKKAAAEAQQQHGERVAFLAEFAEALEDFHFAAVHQACATRGHPCATDDARDLGAAFDGGQDLGVESIDLLAELFDLGLGRLARRRRV